MGAQGPVAAGRDTRRGLSGLRRHAWWLGPALVVAFVASLSMPGRAQPPAADVVPSFAELEAAQARIGEVRIRTEDVFDTNNPDEDSALYRWANALHMQTRASVRQAPPTA